MKHDQCSPAAVLLVIKTVMARAMITSVYRLAIGGLMVMIANCVLLSAQNLVSTGSLSGRVTDQSEALVPGASVVVQNLDTGVRLSANTNRSGIYRSVRLNPERAEREKPSK